MRLLAATLALVGLVAWTLVQDAHPATLGELRARAHRVTQKINRAASTVRWFEHHPAALYSTSPYTRRVAWRAVNLARQRVILGRAELGRIRELIRRRHSHLRRLSPRAAIRLVFGAWADQALRVAACETGGTFDVHARNGDYLGLFQFGSYARHTYGFGWTALEQARAAYRYFKASGYLWTAWSCKP